MAPQQGSVQPYEEAISTYPVGEEPFLNGSGEVEVGGVPTSSTTPSDPVVENPTLTIQKQGNGTSTITVAGSPMSESGTVAAGARSEHQPHPE